MSKETLELREELKRMFAMIEKMESVERAAEEAAALAAGVETQRWDHTQAYYSKEKEKWCTRFNVAHFNSKLIGEYNSKEEAMAHASSVNVIATIVVDAFENWPPD